MRTINPRHQRTTYVRTHGRTGGVRVQQRSAVRSAAASRSARAPSRQAQLSQRLVRSARILYLLEKKAAVGKHSRQHSKKFAHLRSMAAWRPSLLQTTAIIAIAISVYLSVDSWLLNRQVKYDLRQTVAAAQGDETNQDTRQAAEGKDETPISRDVIANYRVAPDLPRVVTIDKLQAKARVLPMSVNNDGSMQAPLNSYDAGWYTGGVKPGQRGAAAIVAHELGPTRGGLFEKLDTLKAGDAVQVERGDGSVLNYRVVATKTVKLEQVNMDEFLRPANGVDEGLNLMSCAGKWIRNAQTRSHRVMVFTKRV